MILTRITKAVREQNWFAVAIEFVIVVSGVFLGFQASTWQAAHEQREDARESLALILRDLEADGAQLETYGVIAQWRYAALTYVLVGSGEQIVDVYVSPYGAIPTPPAEPFDPGPQNDINRPLAFLHGLDIQRRTYDSMINLGTFQHVGNAELSAEIHNYYTLGQRLRRLEQAALLESRDELSRTRTRLGISGRDVMSPEDMIALAREHPDLRAAMGNLAGATEMQLYTLREVTEARDALHARITAELGGAE